MNHLINFQYAQKLFISIKPKYFPEARMAPIFTIYHHHFITTISGDTQLQALRWKLLKNKDLFHISVAATQDPASIVPPPWPSGLPTLLSTQPTDALGEGQTTAGEGWLRTPNLGSWGSVCCAGGLCYNSLSVGGEHASRGLNKGSLV